MEAQTVEGVVVKNSMSEAVLLFRNNASINEGYTDWFVPALGQLAFMCLMQDDLNRLMTLVGGAALTGILWSSTEMNYISAWRIDFKYRSLWNNSKNTKFILRMIKEL